MTLINLSVAGEHLPFDLGKRLKGIGMDDRFGKGIPVIYYLKGNVIADNFISHLPLYLQQIGFEIQSYSNMHVIFVFTKKNDSLLLGIKTSDDIESWNNSVVKGFQRKGSFVTGMLQSGMGGLMGTLAGFTKERIDRVKYEETDGILTKVKLKGDDNLLHFFMPWEFRYEVPQVVEDLFGKKKILPAAAY